MLDTVMGFSWLKDGLDWLWPRTEGGSNPEGLLQELEGNVTGGRHDHLKEAMLLLPPREEAEIRFEGTASRSTALRG
jgi:hypothetical protein